MFAPDLIQVVVQALLPTCLSAILLQVVLERVLGDCLRALSSRCPSSSTSTIDPRRRRSVSAKLPLAGSTLVTGSAGIRPCGTHRTCEPAWAVEFLTTDNSMALWRSALEPLVFFYNLSNTDLASTTDRHGADSANWQSFDRRHAIGPVATCQSGNTTSQTTMAR